MPDIYAKPHQFSVPNAFKNAQFELLILTADAVGNHALAVKISIM